MCEGCKYWDSYTWVCANADSVHCADFTNAGCEHKDILITKEVLENFTLKSIPGKRDL